MSGTDCATSPSVRRDGLTGKPGKECMAGEAPVCPDCKTPMTRVCGPTDGQWFIRECSCESDDCSEPLTARSSDREDFHSDG